ncbi:CIC11C00000004586 [Sungouiella intermedia]|uniref:non-specific serine/threonine protein kinase n=1 Tax=Sungouiella intermedia TaxID=45354 RepID=A0A1L0C2A8_9ASCO|nr:CIC11C00000004586 [[Candida] intermedia]
MSVLRAQDQKQVAELAEQFNQFYLQITLPHVSQIGNYRIIEEIGEGAFGKVYLAQHLILNTLVVLKCGAVDDPNIVREIYYHRQLRHKNIVKLYEVIKTETHLWMALEYCEGLELFYYIYEKRRLNIDVCRHLFYQIVDGIKYVHSLNLSHRDLKLENILLADKRKTVIKLTDFGFVREFNPNKRQFLSTVCGTTAYMAPEVLKNEKYSGFAVDIWSLGVILYAMVYGELPFDEDDDLRNKYKIINEEPVYNDTVAPDIIHLLKRMLNKDPWVRPSLTEIFNSTFLIDITNKKLEQRNSVYNDAESIISISQHYKMNAMPFLSKTEKHLLKKMQKMNVDLDSLQTAVFSGQTNSLTAFYELALTQEFKKKKDRYLKKKRYFEAKRLLKKSRNRVRSALSLSEQNTSAPPLERIISTLSLSSRPDHSASRVSLNRRSTEEHRKPPSIRNSNQPSSRRISLVDRTPNDSYTTDQVSVPYKRAVSFFPDERKSITNLSFSSEPSKGKSKKFFNKLQFWRKTRAEEKPPRIFRQSREYTLSSESFDNQDNGLEITANNKSPSPHIANEKLVVETQVDSNNICEVPPLDHPLFLSNNHRRDVSGNTIPSATSMDTPQMQVSSSNDSYFRRTRPESVVSQISQYSQGSQLYPMSESEIDMLDATDIEDEYLDDEGVYESSINTSHHDLSHLKVTHLSQGPPSKKKRSLGPRSLSDGLIISLGMIKTKKYSLSQVSSNSSDESSARSKLIDRYYDDSGPPTRPISPRTKISRKGHPKLRPLRSISSTKSSSSQTQVLNPLPIFPAITPTNGTIPRSHSPPVYNMSKIANKGTNSMNGILAPKKSEANGNMLANGTANGTSSPLFDTVQVDSRVWKRDNMNGTGTPRRFEFINEEEEEDDDEK